MSRRSTTNSADTSVSITTHPDVLIPHDTPYVRGQFTPRQVLKTRPKHTRNIVLSLVLLMTLGYSWLAVPFGVVAEETVVTPPIYVTYEDNTTEEFLFGSNPLMTQPDFFQDTKESFLNNHVPFVEADLSAMKIKYYEESELVYETDILSKGKEGSWWETPAGVYKVELKEDNHFSSFGQVYQPWSMVFQGNFFIHGWPEYPDGTSVEPGYSGGCIRLATPDAKKLYEKVQTGTPVLVFEEDFANDGFLYEPKAPAVTTDHYLVTDIESHTVLAGDNIAEPLPIASLTKLMTALIAAEYINLDTSVPIVSERYVTTLIPRLEGRYEASMYSLLQLLLVESSNEAAEVIASVIGRDNFIDKMNKKASALGLNDTVFTDPAGLDNGNVSTTADLTRLLQYIYHNRSFVLELTKDADLDTAYVSGEFGPLKNFNEMDGVANFIGGKVGETLAAGQTSATLHTIEVDGEQRLVAIILLNSTNRTEDVMRLHKYVSERYGD